MSAEAHIINMETFQMDLLALIPSDSKHFSAIISALTALALFNNAS
jgi:hypothetical protein